MHRTFRMLSTGILALCSLPDSGGAQSRPLFDTFAYPQPWSALPSQFPALPGAALVQSSPNKSWKKVVWAAARYWPLVDYLAENVTTTQANGPSRLVLSVTPRPGPGLPAGGAEIIADQSVQTFGFGSYRVRMKPSPPTPKGIGVCNAFYFYSPQVELDIEFLSVKQGLPPGTGQVEMAVHDNASRPGSRISLVKYVPLSFDPSKEFHVYGFDWHPNRAEFFVDDQLVAVIRTGDLGRTYIGNVLHQVPIKMPDAASLVPDAIRLSNWTDLPDWCGAPPPTRTDFEVDWVSYSPCFMTTSTTALSLSGGGLAEFTVDAGAGRAGALALTLATPFETNFGLVNPFRSGVILPLEFDWVLLPLMYELASKGSLPGFLSFLDAKGQGTVAFRLFPRQVGPEAVGTRLYFACLTVHPLLGVIQVSSNRICVGLKR